MNTGRYVLIWFTKSLPAEPNAGHEDRVRQGHRHATANSINAVKFNGAS